MTAPAEEIRALVDGAQDARKLVAQDAEPAATPRRPYPTHALPEPLRAYVEAGTHARRVPPEMIALPLFAATAAVIGTTRALRLTSGARPWRAHAIVWALVVARSGSRKSPALDDGIAPLRRVDARLERASASAKAEYDRERERFEAAKARRRKRTTADDFLDNAEPEPVPPPWRQAIVADTTIEALTSALQDNPRGLLVARDELGAWLAGMTRYRSDGGSDSAAWLELYRAGTLKVDRVTRGRVRVRMASASITGTIQPDVLERIGQEHVEDGMLARFALAAPVVAPSGWGDFGISEDIVRSVDRVFDSLAALEHDARVVDDATGETEPVPRDLALTQEAREVWVAWYDGLQVDQARAEGPLAYALAKLEELAARFALVVALAADPGAEEVDGTAMRAGVDLARWHAEEAERLYARWETPREARAATDLADWVARQGPAGVTAREVARGPRRFRRPGGAAAAEQALRALVDAGELVALPPIPGAPGTPATRYARAQGGDTGDTLDARKPVRAGATTRPGRGKASPPSPGGPPERARDNDDGTPCDPVRASAASPLRAALAARLRERKDGPGGAL